MARIEDLISEIPTPELKAALAREVRQLKDRTTFGLAFERHIPESVVLGTSAGVRVGDTVQLRKAPEDPRRFRVGEIKGKRARIDRPEASETVAIDDLLVVKDFGDPIYPTITSIGSVARGGERDPHLVLNGENFHALQVLAYTHAGTVDLIYIDPPYNTGARDWKYNNAYVDDADRYRHSKWLSFMEKRLVLASKLLKRDGVLVVTIDEKEYLRLGLLLEQVFPGHRIQMVSTLINPALQARPGAFGRSDEYIFFVMRGSAAPRRALLARDWVSEKGRTFTGTARWDLLRRSGTSAERKDSPGGFYPIYVDPDGPKFAAVGSQLPDGVSKARRVKGAVAVLPIRKDGSEGRWQVSPATLGQYIEQGRVRIGGTKDKGFVIYYLKGGEYDKVLNGEYPITGRNADGSLRIGEGEGEEVIAVPSTQWRIPSHDATQYGSRLLSKFLPGNRFPYPKSLYAVQDTLRFFLADKRDALVLDFFAGSGTTLHATLLLNASDDGRRRTILVTNNDVGDKLAPTLWAAGHYPGDAEYEAQGIFESITKPRVVAGITGETQDGKKVPGSYLDGRSFAEGFHENALFLQLGYLDPDEVELGRAEELEPLFWLISGGHGFLPDKLDRNQPFAVVEGCRFAVLFDVLALPELNLAITDKPAVEHVFLVTDDSDAFAEMTTAIGPSRTTHMLPQDYLKKFRINTWRNNEA